MAFIITTCALLAIVAVGCTPSLSEVQAFGTASNTLGSAATHALELADTTTVDRKIYSIAADKNTGPTEDTFTGLFDSKPESLRLRLNVLQHLTGYAAALEALASADLSKDVDRASTDLKGALSGLSSSFKKATKSNRDIVTDGDLNIIATAVDAMGKGVIEYKKRSAIRTIIIHADPGVQKAAALIEKDLGKDSAIADYVEKNIVMIQGQMQTGYNDERTRSTSTFEDRLAALKRIQAQALAAHDAPSFFENVSKGAGAVGKAHGALKAAVEKDRFTSDDVIKSVNELIAYAKSVQSYYDSLQQKTSK